METICNGSSVDRISYLPNSVIDQILAFLPIRDAVKTSALSKKWIKKWQTVPCIIIDEDLFHKDYFRKLEGVINYILMTHQGRIEKFSVFVEVEDSYDVKSWIFRLRRKGIQELSLLYRRQYISQNQLPSILFSLQQLRKLALRRCVVNLPRTFRGFPNLISLKLDKIQMNTVPFVKFISSCPLLEQLTLRKVSVANDLSRYHHEALVDHLEINAPKLKYLSIDGGFLSMRLNTPFLEVLSINLFKNNSRYYSEDPRSFYLRFKFAGLPSTIKELYVRCEFHKYLEACDRLIEGVTYSHLKTLQLDEFCFEDDYQVRCLLSCLFRSSTNLTTLDIAACGCESKDVSKPFRKFWELLNNAPFMLNQLKKVRVRSFHGNDPEMKFIRYLMTNSPALEQMTIDHMENPEFDKDEVKGVLQLLCKSSTQLNFFVPNHESKDKDKDDCNDNDNDDCDGDGDFHDNDNGDCHDDDNDNDNGDCNNDDNDDYDNDKDDDDDRQGRGSQGQGHLRGRGRGLWRRRGGGGGY